MNGLASFLVDVPSSIQRDLAVQFPAYRAVMLFSYLQDKWQVSQKLTVDLGVRHDFYPPATPRLKGGFSNYDPSTNTLVVAGYGNNPMNLGRKTYYTGFAPRVGFAYRLDHQDGAPRRLRPQLDSVPGQQVCLGQLPGQADQRVSEHEHVRAVADADRRVPLDGHRLPCA